jgi:hypothetical protein
MLLLSNELTESQQNKRIARRGQATTTQLAATGHCRFYRQHREGMHQHIMPQPLSSRAGNGRLMGMEIAELGRIKQHFLYVSAH